MIATVAGRYMRETRFTVSILLCISKLLLTSVDKIKASGLLGSQPSDGSVASPGLYRSGSRTCGPLFGIDS